MKRKIFLLTGAAVLILLVAGYFTVFKSLFNGDSTNPPDSEDSYEYFSFTHQEELEDLSLVAHVYEFNMKTKISTEIFSYPMTAFYILGVYDKKDNAVYYSKQNVTGMGSRGPTGGDQLFRHDLKTGEDVMLTENLIAINQIIPTDEAVFFLAAGPRGSDCLVLGKYDKVNGNVTYWDEDNTVSIFVIAVDRIQKRIYTSVYDPEEDYKAMIAGTNRSVTHTIYSYDYNLGDKKMIVTEENQTIASITCRDNKLFYGTHDTLTIRPEESVFKSVLIDVGTMKELLRKEGVLISGSAALTEDFHQFYSKDSNGGFCTVDIVTWEKTSIFKDDSVDIVNCVYFY